MYSVRNTRICVCMCTFPYAEIASMMHEGENCIAIRYDIQKWHLISQRKTR